jgi:hypothetical protein
MKTWTTETPKKTEAVAPQAFKNAVFVMETGRLVCIAMTPREAAFISMMPETLAALRRLADTPFDSNAVFQARAVLAKAEEVTREVPEVQPDSDR